MGAPNCAGDRWWRRRDSNPRQCTSRARRQAIVARPDTAVLDVQMKKIPALAAGISTGQMVAGARYEPVQIEMRPLSRYLAGLRRAAYAPPPHALDPATGSELWRSTLKSGHRQQNSDNAAGAAAAAAAAT